MDGIKEIFNKKDIGKECKEIRENNGMSISEFARRANCTRQTVYNFENGKNVSLQLYLCYKRFEGVTR